MSWMCWLIVQFINLRAGFRLFRGGYENENYKMKNANKTKINSMTFILIFLEDCLYYDAILNFSVEPVLIQRILIGLEAIL